MCVIPQTKDHDSFSAGSKRDNECDIYLRLAFFCFISEVFFFRLFGSCCNFYLRWRLNRKFKRQVQELTSAFFVWCWQSIKKKKKTVLKKTKKKSKKIVGASGRFCETISYNTRRWPSWRATFTSYGWYLLSLLQHAPTRATLWRATKWYGYQIFLSFSLFWWGFDSAVESGGAFHGQIGHTKENRTHTHTSRRYTKGKARRAMEGQWKQRRI